MENNNKKHKPLKRIFALSGVIFLAVIYLITLVSAFISSPASNALFMASLACTVIIPVIIYVFIRLFKPK